MLYLDQRPFKREIIDLIQNSDVVDFVERATYITNSYDLSLDTDQFVRQLYLLVRTNNRDRAIKLVNVIGDKGLSGRGAALFTLVGFCLKWAIVFGIVYLIAKSV